MLFPLEPKALVGALASLEAPELSTSALVPTSSKGGMASLSFDKHLTYWHYWCILMCMYINYTVWYHCGNPGSQNKNDRHYFAKGPLSSFALVSHPSRCGATLQLPDKDYYQWKLLHHLSSMSIPKDLIVRHQNKWWLGHANRLRWCTCKHCRFVESEAATSWKLGELRHGRLVENLLGLHLMIWRKQMGRKSQQRPRDLHGFTSYGSGRCLRKKGESIDIT